MTGRLALGVGLFLGSLGLGWSLGRFGWLSAPASAKLTRFSVRCLAPLALCLAFWRPELTNPRVLMLPLIGFLVACSSLAAAYAYVKAVPMTRPQQGSFLTCAMFPNIGFLGAIVAFALYGELAYSLAMLYVIYFDPSFYLIGFTIAQRYGAQPARAQASGSTLRWYPLAGLALGLAFSLMRIPRPPALGSLNQFIIPLSTSTYLLAIGSQMRLGGVGRWWREGLVMSGIKLGVSPLVGWLLVLWFGLDGLPRSIVMLQSMMPVAISPLMLPLLFGLDEQLSGALWLVTTVLAAPMLILMLPLIA